VLLGDDGLFIEDGCEEGSKMLYKIKATALGAPVKLAGSFAKRKSVPVPPKKMAPATEGKFRSQASISPNPFKMVESDLASSLMPELLPKDAVSRGKVRNRSLPPLPLALGSKFEAMHKGHSSSDGAAVIGSSVPASWEPRPWDELESFPEGYVGDTSEIDIANADSFDEFQGYGDAGYGDADDAVAIEVAKKHIAVLDAHLTSTAAITATATPATTNATAATNGAGTGSANSSLHGTPEKEKKIVGKGRKRTDCASYDPEEQELY
jgi:hypothetical protein